MDGLSELHAGGVLFGENEVDPHPYVGRQRGDGITRIQILAEIDLSDPNGAVEGRADMLLVDHRLHSGDIALRGFEARRGCFQILMALHAGPDERTGTGQIGLGRAQFAALADQLALFRRVIEDQEQLAFPDGRPGIEIQFGDPAGDFRGERYPLKRLDLTDRLDMGRERDGSDLPDGYRRCRSVGSPAGGGQGHQHRESGGMVPGDEEASHRYLPKLLLYADIRT
ncbi:hypothetical protein ATPR_3467 [Acetobacter tropicalis NBRC 101654]|uniref:Uncharacterized protein n=1 Tax=Acetobacter tropicalis NBRC 101654 TaxID=749388 RepID=F7VJB8_9PROT|nr:hypothetical protein ATPR_3467 [Acetobacter tropicalis NBRC 101654]